MTGQLFLYAGRINLQDDFFAQDRSRVVAPGFCILELGPGRAGVAEAGHFLDRMVVLAAVIPFQVIRLFGHAGQHHQARGR